MSGASQRGFSIVEVMVAMTLSLILLAGVLFVVQSSKVTYGEGERVARLQENGRAAVEIMLRDMRAGGFRGCAQGPEGFENTLNDSDALLWDFESLVQGFDYVSSETWSPSLDAVVESPLDGSDVVAIRTVRADMPAFQTDVAVAGDASITVDRNGAEDLEAGRPVLMSDCTNAAVFAVSSYTPDGATATIAHASGGAAGAGPGNSTDDFGFGFQPGAEIVPVDTVVYYLRASETERDGGVRNPSLWRIVGSADPEELIEGVERMHILYGVDTDGDRIVNTYVAASAVGNWSRVISLSLAVLIRSPEPTAREKDTRTYSLLGTDAGPFNDSYERTLYTTTVALRNNTT